MPFFIKKATKTLYLRTEIDPGGMSVNWTSKTYADDFSSKEDAARAAKIIKHRYPTEDLEIVEG